MQETEQTTVELESPTHSTGTEIAEFNPLRAELDRLNKSYLNVVHDVSTPKGLNSAKEARKDIRDVRYAIQNTAKEIIKPYQQEVKNAQAKVTAVKTIGEDLAAGVLKLEEPIDEQIKAEERRLLEEREERERLERERIEKLQAKINHFRQVPLAMNAKTSEEIAAMLERVENAGISAEEYGDLAGEAFEAKTESVSQLKTLLGQVTDREERDRQAEVMQRELAELRAAQEQRDLEAAEQQRLLDQKAAEERERIRLQDEEAARLERQRLADEAADLQRQRDELAQQQEAFRQQQAALVAAAAPAPVATVVEELEVLTEQEVLAPVVLVAQPESETVTPSAIEVEDLAPQTEAPAMPSAQQIVDALVETFGLTDQAARELLRVTEF